MRSKIQSEVQKNPGIHFRQLQRNLNCSPTTVNYHTEKMDVRERKIHSYRRIYPPDVPESMERALAALNHEVRGPILFHVSNRKTASELAEELNITGSTVSTHLKVLKQDGLIEQEKKGRRKILHLTENSVLAVRKYASQLLDEASEGFIDMWE